MRTAFNNGLARGRRIYLGGLLLAAGLRLLAFAGAAFLACVLLDALFAFDERTRMLMGFALLLGTAAFAGYCGVTILTLSRRAIACWIDGRLPSRRRPVLSALELADAPAPEETSPFGRYLVDQALDQGRQALAALTARQVLPLRLLRRDALRLAAALAIWIALALVWTVPVQTHVLRMLVPARDIPPWSRLAFTIVPESPSVIYGDSLEIAATVDGPVGSRPILFEVRGGGHTHRSAGFRESTNRFVHRLERVVQPLQFCVRAGRARSRWHELTVLYQPRIASARVTLTPPEYTGLPAREFYLGGQKLSGLRGSQVALEIVANRPIRRGSIVFTRPDGTQARIEGRAPGDQSIRYEWRLETDATASIQIQDPLGTPNAGTHAFTQELLPDEPPVATLLQPPRYSLATPDSVVLVEAEAEDALGLRSVALVRNLAGYRDRAQPVGIAAGARQAQVAQPLDLHLLGAQPGDIIELYAEAADTNPDLLGAAMSDIGRIDVISGDEYAEILRMRTAVEEFGERYDLISRQLDELREALRALAEMPDAGDDARAKAIQQALAAWQDLDQTYQGIADDFAIYDLEKQLPAVLTEIRSQSEPHADDLKGLPAPFAGSGEIAAQWLAAIRDAGAKLDQQAEDAKLADQLMRVARSALDLQMVIDRQAALVRELSRYEANLRTTPASVLAAFAEDQALLAARLEEWFAETSALADALPSDQSALAENMRALVAAIRASQALDSMERAASAARGENAAEAYRYAQEALAALRNACSQCEKSGNSYAAMCRNPGQGFSVKDGLCNTLSQLCQALLRQFGSQNGPGGVGLSGGGAYGGDPANGYWASGSSVLDVPLHGPARSAMHQRTGRGEGHGGAGQGGAGRVQSSESVDRQSTAATGTRAVTLDEIPERYREPARIFYGIDAAPERMPAHE